MERKSLEMTTISSVKWQDHIPGLLFLKHDGAQVPAVKQRVPPRCAYSTWAKVSTNMALSLRSVLFPQVTTTDSISLCFN